MDYGEVPSTAATTAVAACCQRFQLLSYYETRKVGKCEKWDLGGNKKFVKAKCSPCHEAKVKL